MWGHFATLANNGWHHMTEWGAHARGAVARVCQWRGAATVELQHGRDTRRKSGVWRQGMLVDDEGLRRVREVGDYDVVAGVVIEHIVGHGFFVVMRCLTYVCGECRPCGACNPQLACAAASPPMAWDALGLSADGATNTQDELFGRVDVMRPRA